MAKTKKKKLDAKANRKPKKIRKSMAFPACAVLIDVADTTLQGAVQSSTDPGIHPLKIVLPKKK
jgi:hypothetical protein